ncbi:DUF1801 domain-containing protein [Alphaproteobacteria bacterium GH1-50]|uniref:DUF1801 domain-containing protein n=1 Tax=Kangsaoukella pontilimi TaxID=2691042 RepID=A0A7C9IGB1_9RHOB|nr:DUF1801 domain-containing protein [Kangsaoukella pontilimi]MXQ07807.1 DUF1801 domain-containing protein [Kangsaoukella pontilimi]
MLAPIAALTDDTRKQDALALDALFREVTGFQPRLWGEKIGYGKYHYRYDSGREGDWLATGFGIGKREFSIYILPGYTEFPSLAARLGPHRRGKSCWYVKRMDEIDTEALADLIRSGLDDLAKTWPVEPT